MPGTTDGMIQPGTAGGGTPKMFPEVLGLFIYCSLEI